MVKLIMVGLVASLTAAPVAFTLASALSWLTRSREYWSAILSDAALRDISRWRTAAVLWPMVSAAVGFAIAYVVLPGRSVAVAVTAIGVTALVLAIADSLVQAIRRTKYERDATLSKETQRQIEGDLARRWQQISSGDQQVKIEVKAFRTQSGIEGSVTVWLPAGSRPSPEVTAKLAPLVPAYLKLRVRS